MVAIDPDAPRWMQIVHDRRTTSLEVRARAYEAEVRVAFRGAPPTTERKRFAAWVHERVERLRPALFELFDGVEPAWAAHLDRYERRMIKQGPS